MWRGMNKGGGGGKEKMPSGEFIFRGLFFTPCRLKFILLLLLLLLPLDIVWDEISLSRRRYSSAIGGRIVSPSGI